MWRLIFAELKYQSRLWVGALAVALTASIMLSVMVALVLSAVQLERSAQVSADDFEGIIGFVSMPVLLSAITMIVVLTGVANLTVEAQRQNYARWQIGGVSPSKVTRIVMLQLVVLGAVASVVGVLIALPLTQPVFDWLSLRVPSLRDLPVGQSVSGALIVIFFVCALMTIGGRRAAKRAGRVPAVEALRAPVDPTTRMSIGGWLVAIAALAATVGLAGGLQTVGITGIGQNGLFVGLALSMVLAALAPLLLRPALSAWTALVPARVSAAWFLARNACGYRIGQSASTVIPLTIGLVLVGSFTSVFSMFVSAQAAATGASSQMDGEANLIVFGAPLTLATVAAVVTVFMSGRAREREFALISAAGGTPRLVLRTSVLEAVIYAVTALILSLVITLATVITVWLAFVRVAPGTSLSLELAPMMIMFLIGLVGLLAATTVPTARGLRTSVREALSA